MATDPQSERRASRPAHDEFSRKPGGPPGCPSDPLSACSSSTLKGRFANHCTGGLSPGRIRIGNLCLSARRSSCSPTRLMDKPSLQTLQAINTCVKDYNGRASPMPAVRVFHRAAWAENVSLVCRNQGIQRHVYLALFYGCQF
jgi:hypothetical protein